MYWHVEDRVRPAWPRNAFVYLLILVASIALFYSFLAPSDNVRELPLNKVAELIQSGNVERLSVTNEGNHPVSCTRRLAIAELYVSQGTQCGVSRDVAGAWELRQSRCSRLANWWPCARACGKTGVLCLIQIVPLVLIGLVPGLYVTSGPERQ